MRWLLSGEGERLHLVDDRYGPSLRLSGLCGAVLDEPRTKDHIKHNIAHDKCKLCLRQAPPSEQIVETH